MSRRPHLAEVTKPLDPEVKQRIHDATRHCIESPTDATPMIATEQQVQDVLRSWLATEAVEERFYEAHAERRWIQLLTPVADALRRPAEQAAEAFRFATAPDLPAILATCRPHEPWVMHSAEDLDHAYAVIANEIHCDLQINGPVVIDRKRHASCVDWFAHCLQTVRRADGTNGQLERDFFAQNFLTIPVARGDLVILMRVCCWCLGAFLGQNAVDPAECAVENIYSDGFGLLPFKVIVPPASDKRSDEPPEETIYATDVQDYDEDDEG
jgi:hypothetical protein